MHLFTELKPYRYNLCYTRGTKDIDNDLEWIFKEINTQIKIPKKYFKEHVEQHVINTMLTNSGIFVPFRYKDCGILFIFDYIEKDYNMVHELSHALLYLFKKVGLEIDFETGSDEAYCYLFDETYSKIINFIKK